MSQRRFAEAAEACARLLKVKSVLLCQLLAEKAQRTLQQSYFSVLIPSLSLTTPLTHCGACSVHGSAARWEQSLHRTAEACRTMYPKA